MELKPASLLQDQPDEGLVAASLAGNREAFGQIVAKYQALVCSLAYSATGSLARSEDLAQEVFLTAWKQLASLREPGKLRSWLCGIARFVIGKNIQREERQPVHAAEPLDELRELAGAEPPPADRVITSEEQAIMWQALARLPEMYREPLVLFYREGQSIARVAEALELSEDNVKQRLSRGRNLLREEVALFIEGALQRSAPGPAFTIAVVGALPVIAGSAAGATLSAAAAKTGAAAKGLLTASSVATAGGLLGSAIGLGGAVAGAAASIRNTKSPRERQFMIRQIKVMVVFVTFFILAMFGMTSQAGGFGRRHPALFVSGLVLLIGGYAAALVFFIIRSNRRQKQIQIEDGTFQQPPSVGAQLKIMHENLCCGPAVMNRTAALSSLLGSIGGALAWLVVLGLRCGDWLGASVVVELGALTTVLSYIAWRRRCNWLRILAWSLAAVGAITLGVLNWRWKLWTEVLGASAIGGVKARTGLNIGLAALYGFLFLGMQLLNRLPRKHN